MILALDVNRPFYIGYSTSKIAKTILSLNNQALTEIYDNLDTHALEKAAKLIVNANTIFLYGHGDSSIRARTFMNKLFKINKLCILATDSNEEAGISNNATPKDVAVLISYRGGSDRFFECAKILRERKCPMIVLSSDFKTELTQNCDVWLKIGDKEKSADNIATFYSQACFDYLLNVIYSLVYASSYTKSHNHNLQIDHYTAKR
jgi:DNA-binding MurR/RpiR family transcriptional regulator